MNIDISAVGIRQVFNRFKKTKPFDTVDIKKRTYLDIQSSPVILRLGGAEEISYLKVDEASRLC
jgi:hypothetical protein